MKKEFIYPQPPLADYFTLLVDDLNKTATFADLADMDKIEYIDLMGLEMNFNVQVQTALSDKGVTGVFPVGRYIMIYKSSKDETIQHMTFIDHLSKANFREQNIKLLGGYYSENIVSAFEKVHEILRKNFRDEDDLVELLMV